MLTQLQRDREFSRSIGIQTDPDHCEMCDLFAIERRRRAEDLGRAIECAGDQARTIFRHRQTIRAWQLATFAATVLMILFAYSSIHRVS